MPLDVVTIVVVDLVDGSGGGAVVAGGFLLHLYSRVVGRSRRLFMWMTCHTTTTTAAAEVAATKVFGRQKIK